MLALLTVGLVAAACVMPTPPDPVSLVSLEVQTSSPCVAAFPITVVNNSPWPVRIDYIGLASTDLQSFDSDGFSVDTEVIAPSGGRGQIADSLNRGKLPSIWFTFLGGPTVTATTFNPVGSAIQGFVGGHDVSALQSSPPLTYSGKLPHEKFWCIGSTVG